MSDSSAIPPIPHETLDYYDEPDSLAYLKGADDTENIVGMHPVFGDDMVAMRLYFRDPATDNVHHEDEQFYPFFYAKENAARMLWLSPIDVRVRNLKGSNPFDYIVVATEWNDYKQALNWIYTKFDYPEPPLDEDGNYDYDHRMIEEVYLPGSITTQFLMQSGKTMFKGMAFSDVLRMQVDIETYTERDFPNAERPEDTITIIAMSDSSGWEKLLYLDHPGKTLSHPKGVACADEAELLRALVIYIKNRDPDVISGHNIFGFDWDYIRQRAEMHGVPLTIGRNGEEPFFYDSSRTFAERDIDYPMCNIPGRSVIDTWFLTIAYDVFARDMPGHGLKDAAKYFGVEGGDGNADDRTYVEGSDIPRLWREDPQQLIDYALDDVRETRAIEEHLSGSTFYTAQMLPFTYQDVERYGTATTIEALFIREYLRKRHSVPEPDEGRQSEGGYTDIFVQGVIDRLVYADVSSLYPAIMLNYRCEPGPEKDPLGMFPLALEKLTDLRLDAKKKMNDLSDEIKRIEENKADVAPGMPNPGRSRLKKLRKKRDELDARQSSYKILINSFYGSLGFNLFSWNNISEADRVALTGQELLKGMIREIERDGGTIIECDTDGVLFSPLDPETGQDQMGIPRTDEDEARYVRSLTERMPEGIIIDHDGSFERMISYKKKNYALKKYGSDSIKIKGSSMISRAYEQFGRDFIKEMIRLMMDRDVQAIHDLYVATYRMIERSEWSVEDFQRNQTLKDSFAEYENKVQKGHGNGGHSRFARYEVARRHEKRTGLEYAVGDRVSFYVATPSHGRTLTSLTISEAARHADLWDPEAPDEYTEYYIKNRLHKFTDKFRVFFGDYDFKRVFSLGDGLFGFDPAGIELVTQRVRPPLVPAREVASSAETTPPKPEPMTQLAQETAELL